MRFALLTLPRISLLIWMTALVAWIAKSVSGVGIGSIAVLTKPKFYQYACERCSKEFFIIIPYSEDYTVICNKCLDVLMFGE